MAQNKKKTGEKDISGYCYHKARCAKLGKPGGYGAFQRLIIEIDGFRRDKAAWMRLDTGSWLLVAGCW